MYFELDNFTEHACGEYFISCDMMVVYQNFSISNENKKMPFYKRQSIIWPESDFDGFILIGVFVGNLWV